MTEDEIWRVVHERRLSVADLLDDLGPEEWDRPTLCAEWRVRDVAAHLTQQQLTVRDELKMLALWRGSVENMTRDAARRKARSASPAQLVAELRETAASRRHTVGVTQLECLIDLLVHEQDIALPLGRRREMPAAAAAIAATRVLTMRFPPPLPSVRGMAGVRLVATDVAWTHGDGPVVEGPMAALLLVCAGRTVALPELSGPGADRLRGNRS
jgi:uncharacterized protein (TIGR03083 family)